MRYKLVGENFYRYEHDFEEEAIYCQNLQIDEPSAANNEENLDEATKLSLIYERLERLKNKECTICMEKLSLDPDT